MKKIKPLSRLLHIEEKELLEFEILRRDQIHALLLEQKNWLEIEERYQELTERKIAFVTPLEPNYPDKLRQIHHPPMGLYVRGQLPKEEKKSVAIVGSRDASEYGISMAREYAKVLAENGVQIISGLAHGVDAAAHAGAVRFGLSFGVLGCGINIAYPKENYTLYEKNGKRWRRNHERVSTWHFATGEKFSHSKPNYFGAFGHCFGDRSQRAIGIFDYGRACSRAGKGSFCPSRKSE